MTKLTILVPNYNRSAALDRLLRTVYAAISHSASADRVDVAVVDDHSTEDIQSVVEPYRRHANFKFALQTTKCGNAETAFLTALDHVSTEYVWLLGNDDYVSVESIGYLLRVLDTAKPGFVLLNPRITKATINRGFVPLNATSLSVVYERAEDLFLDFGFVTSTTTFPCLVLKVEPVRKFHQTHRLIDHARVYSHTFTLYGALRNEPAIFLASPIVGFTLNERIDEQRKLQKQAPAGIMFYHQSLGLARLIARCAAVSGTPISTLGAAFEDEVNKDAMRVAPTHLSHFLAFFFLEQLCREQHNVQSPRAGFGHLVRSEIDEVESVIEQFNDPDLWELCSEAIEAFGWQSAKPAWKIKFLREAQGRLRELGDRRYQYAGRELPKAGPKKVATPEFSMIALRGVDGGRYGVTKNQG